MNIIKRKIIGRLSKQGIDCSRLIYVTFRERFGINMPRSTELLSKEGKKVKLKKLRAGDLIFFKIRFKGMHVGICMDNNKFLHTSKKIGVMISKVNGYYWQDKYWHSRRITDSLFRHPYFIKF